MDENEKKMGTERPNYYQHYSKFVVQIARCRREQKNPAPLATGFLFADFRTAQKKGNYLTRVITNKHVLYSKDKEGKILAKMNDIAVITNVPEDFEKYTQVIRFLDEIPFEWSPHDNGAIDVASFCLPAESEDQLGSVPEDIGVLCEDSMMDFDQLDEGDEVFFLGFPIGLGASSRMLTSRDSPILRRGIIAFKDSKTKAFLIDGFSFPGNSGSPVFIKRKYDDQLVDIKLVGIISAGYNFEEPLVSLQTGDIKMIISDNMGLSIAYSCDTIKETLKPLKKIKKSD